MFLKRILRFGILYLSLLSFEAFSLSCNIPERSRVKRTASKEDVRLALQRKMGTYYTSFNIFKSDINPLNKKYADSITEVDIGEIHEPFMKFSKEVFALILSEPSVLKETHLGDFASFIKHVTLDGSDDMEIQDYMECIFSGKYSTHILSYLVWKTVASERALQDLHLNREQFKEHLFFEFMRQENDIIFLCILASDFVKRSQWEEVQNSNTAKKFQDLQNQSSLRIILALSLYSQIDPKIDEALGKALDENKYSSNHKRGRDFDYYGRYGQAGQVIQEYLKFKSKMERTEWADTRLIFYKILEDVHNSIGNYKGNYMTFLRKLREPIPFIDRMSGYEILLNRDINFGIVDRKEKEEDVDFNSKDFDNPFALTADSQKHT